MASKVRIQEFVEGESARRKRFREFQVVEEETRATGQGSGVLRVVEMESAAPTTAHSILSRLRNVRFFFARSVKELFLPQGYPRTVADGYWEYQVFDSIQGLCSYLRGVVSSAHVLQAAGVGDASATAWGAALTWALKDGIGLMGGLVFAAWAAPLFDAYVKEFRFFADLINNVALTIDMITPLLVFKYGSSYFLWLAAASTLCKTMCGMSAGATKGSITQHFATHGNLADLHAKEGTQETLVSILGMTLGIGLASYFRQVEQEQNEAERDTLNGSITFFPSDTAATAWKVQWAIFLVLTAVHVWANYRAVQLLRLETLNRQRLTYVVRPLVCGLAERVIAGNTREEETSKLVASVHLPSPKNVHESLLASTYHMLLPQRWSRIKRGVPLVALIAACCRNADEVTQLLDGFADEAYVSAIDENGNAWVTLLDGANDGTELQAYLHSLLLCELFDTGKSRHALSIHIVIRQLFDPSSTIKLRSHLNNLGWHTGTFYFEFSRLRSRWYRSKSE